MRGGPAGLILEGIDVPFSWMRAEAFSSRELPSWRCNFQDLGEFPAKAILIFLSGFVSDSLFGHFTVFENPPFTVVCSCRNPFLNAIMRGMESNQKMAEAFIVFREVLE